MKLPLKPHWFNRREVQVLCEGFPALPPPPMVYTMVLFLLQAPQYARDLAAAKLDIAEIKP